MFSVLIRGGLVVDGTGGPAKPADVGIEGDRITAVGRLEGAPAEREIDAAGLAVAPGFIDVHTHSDLTLLVDPRGLSKIRQGVTTDLAGHCGSSPYPFSASPERNRMQRCQTRYGNAVDWTWTDLKGYSEALTRHSIGMNIAPLVGHGTIRSTVIGFDDRPATTDEIREMQKLTAEAMEQGAFGLSTGLTLTPSAYGDTDEVVALAQAMAAYPGRIYDTHMRIWAGGHVNAVVEAIEIGRRAGVPVQMAHMAVNDPPYWGQADKVAEVAEKAVAEGVDVTFDVYPYAASSSGFSQHLPTWAQSGGQLALAERIRDPYTRAKIRADMEENGTFRGWPWLWDRFMICKAESEKARPYLGMTFQQAAEAMGCDPFEASLTLMDWEDGGLGIILFYRTEEDVSTFLKHPLGMVGSDGLAIMPEGVLGQGKPHPRSYGAHVRVLGRYVREKGVLTLEQAVHKMSGKVADRLGLKDRGRILPGKAADIVVFDPARVIDRADFVNPHQFPIGIPYVLVNGQITVANGEHTGTLAGRVLEPQ